MSDEAPETFTKTFAGREIEFRRAHLAQVIVLERLYHRQMKKANESGDDKGKALSSVLVRTLDFIDTLVVDEDDRQFIEDQMLAGTIDWPEVMSVLAGGKDEALPDDETPEPVKRAPRKSPKVAPVDLSDKKPAQIVPKAAKVANRARTKR